MRVLFITGEFPPMQGGVGDYTWSLGVALTQRGVDVHVLTSNKAGPAHLIPSGIDDVYADITNWRWGLARHVQSVVREVQPDVVHIQYQSAAYDVHPAINLLPRALRKVKQSPATAVTFHDLRTPYIFPKAGPLRWRANLALADHANAVIVTNAEDEARLRSEPAVAGKMYEVPIGANIQPNSPTDFQRATQRAAWGVGENDLLLAYFGFLNDSKGGEELMLAVARLAALGVPVHLLMIGGQVGASDLTNRAYLQRVEQSIQDMGLSDRVHWTGYITADEVSANFCAADIVVLPYRDGVSFRRGSLMAAIAHGRPVISTEPVVEIPELKHQENIWLTPVRSPELLTQAASYLWQHPALRERLGAGAQELAQQFTWDAIADRHVEIYRAIA